MERGVSNHPCKSVYVVIIAVQHIPSSCAYSPNCALEHEFVFISVSAECKFKPEMVEFNIIQAFNQ